MLDIKWIRANPDKLDKSLSKRGIDPVSKSIIHIDSEKRTLISLIQKLQHERKEKSSSVAHIYDKSSTDFEEIQNDVKLINQKITELETSLLHHEKRLSEIMDNLPNLVADDVPYGTNSDMNKVLKECGTIQNIKFPKHHYEIGKNLGMMDFNTATKMSGSRFVILKH
ncbi:seryl-tRNA synthetase N-terminal domain protein, partial [Orientia tsutsugamushi str. UT76]